jgi:hypothetical protein
MAKGLSGITLSELLPEFLLGGTPNADPKLDKFKRFSKEVLLAVIAELIQARKNNITVTNITGNLISHPAIANRNIAYLIIDDTIKQLNISKTGADAAAKFASDTLSTKDEFVFSPDQTITIIFE